MASPENYTPPQDHSERFTVTVGDLSHEYEFNIGPDGGFNVTNLDRQDNTILGRRVGATAGFAHLSLAKADQGKGLGSALLAETETRLARQGVSALYAKFHKPRTVQFLRRQGYDFADPAAVTGPECDQLYVLHDVPAQPMTQQRLDDLVALGIEKNEEPILLVKKLGE